MKTIGALLTKYPKELGGDTFNYAILLVKNLMEVQKYVFYI
jgi:hypothetical protein